MKGDKVKGLKTRSVSDTKMMSVRKKCEDARGGQEPIHEAGVTYLPKLSGQLAAEYSAYKMRAAFYEATGRTADAFIGMIQRVPASVSQASNLLDDVTGHGDSLYDFTRDVIEISLVSGLGGLLVDYTKPVDGITTVAQAQAAGLRPFLTLYSYQCIYGYWLHNKRLTRIVLEEHANVKVDSDTCEEVNYYKVLDIDEAGYYRQRTFQQVDNSNHEFIQIDDDFYPLINGIRLTEIPFSFIGCPNKLPTLLGVVNMNISHYLTTAEYENACHFIGSPTPILAGFGIGKSETITMGSHALTPDDPAAKAYFLQLDGNSLINLERNLERKEKSMAALGAHMLSNTVVDTTATSAALRSSGEFSVLAQLAHEVSKLLTWACTFMHRWGGLPDVTITLNTNFVPTTATPQDIMAWIAAAQSGNLSPQSVYENLKQGGVKLHGATFEDEAAAIGEQAPTMLGVIN